MKGGAVAPKDVLLKSNTTRVKTKTNTEGVLLIQLSKE